VKSRTEGFGPEVKRRIMTGTFVLSQGYYDAYYAKAQKVRRLIKDRTDEILAQHDVILLPTAPTTAFKLGDVKDPLQMYLQDIFTVHANLSGNPAISLPIGMHSNGMPFGLQLIANNFEEAKLLSISDYLIDFC
jgi:aspartyl-tRNA(Asn)/glutamyl-tRNA(Gln) amidotransferase subunit A